MIALTESQHDLLTAIKRAGSDGYTIDQGDLADCLLMGVYGLVTSPTGTPMRVVITQRGRPFAHRVAA